MALSSLVQNDESPSTGVKRCILLPAQVRGTGEQEEANGLEAAGVCAIAVRLGVRMGAVASKGRGGGASLLAGCGQFLRLGVDHSGKQQFALRSSLHLVTHVPCSARVCSK